MADIFRKYQRFAAGDVMNFSGNNEARTITLSDGSTMQIPHAYAGSMNANNYVAGTGTGDLSVEMKTFYNKALIELAEPALVHDQFAQKKPIPRNGGKTIEFRKFQPLEKALNPITEGVTPKGNKLKAEAFTTTVDQFGDFIEQTDLLELTAIDNTIVEATKVLASQAGRTLDTVTREVLAGGTSVFYARKIVGSSLNKVESRADITANCPLTIKDVFFAATELKNVNAPKIGESYVAFIHPIVAYTLMQEAGDAWTGIQKYKNPEKIYKGELGMLGGVRFVESTEAKIYGPGMISDKKCRLTVKDTLESAGKTLTVEEVLTAGTYTGEKKIPVYINGKANYITAIANNTTYSTLTLENNVLTSDGTAGNLVCGQGGGKDGSAVFCTIFIGEGAYATTELTGGGLEHVVKQLGYGNDPLNQRGSVGWKATKAATRLVEQYIVRVESGSPDYSAITDSN